MSNAERKPVHPDVSVEQAWQEGRRLYVRCAYESALNRVLVGMGAHWDADAKARWVGSAKREQVVAALAEREDRRKAVEDVKAAGRWVVIPYEAEDIRRRAKELRAVYSGSSKMWAFPTSEGHQEVKGLVDAWNQGRQEALEKAQQRRKTDEAAWAAQEKQREAEAAAARGRAALERSGRTPTGEHAELRIISTRRMNKHTAQQAAYGLGELVRLKDGRRGVVVAVKVWFTGDDMASSVCWHDETHDQAHWDLLHTLAVVDATEEEVAADAEEAAVEADARALHAFAEEVEHLGGRERDWSHVPAEDIAGTIGITYGSTYQNGGRIYLTRDGRVVLQHPGWYDDYIRTEGVSTDPVLVGKARALIAAGSRSRTAEGMQVHFYKVTVPEEDHPGA